MPNPARTAPAWVVTVEFDDRPHPGAARALAGQLLHFSAAVAPSDWGNLQAALTVYAHSLGEAVGIAIAVVHECTGRRVVSVSVLSAADHAARADAVPMPVLMGTGDAAETLDISRQAVLKWIERGTLPARKVGTDYVIPASVVLARATARRRAGDGSPDVVDGGNPTG
jgi:excisionase family DNA binding protein